MGGETVYELVLSEGSVDGTFVYGQNITAEANDDPDSTLYAKMVAIITGYNAETSTSSQYYDIGDPLTVTASNGADASFKIESLNSGNIIQIITDAGGSGYETGDTVTVNNANTNGTNLAAQVALVNGGIAPETGDLVTEFNITLETATGPGDVLLEDSTGSVSNYITQEENYGMIAEDHIILENFTVFPDGIMGQKIAQESGTGSGDVTDIVVTSDGYGYTKTPLLTLPTTGSRTGATIYAKGTGLVGSIRDATIIDAGAHYTAPVTIGALTNFLMY